MRRHRAALLAGAISLAAAGCSDDTRATPSSSSASPSTTTSDAAPARPALFADAGPYAAGVTTLTASDGRRVLIWYPVEPADVATLTTESIDLASFLPPDLESKVAPSPDTLYATDAYRDAPPSHDGPFPVALFSHGFSGYPEEYQFLTAHLATWGFVVAAPDHVERNLAAVFGGSVSEGDEGAVLLSALDTAAADPDIAALMDQQQVVAAGHSAGTKAASQAGADPRIDALVLLSPVPNLPSTGKPTLVMVGSDDKITTAPVARSVYDNLPTPKRLATLVGAGHNTFTDACAFHAGPGAAMAIVVRAGVELPEPILAASADGCQETALPIAAAWPAIRHVTVAVMRAALGIDESPIGLDRDGLADLAPAEVELLEG